MAIASDISRPRNGLPKSTESKLCSFNDQGHLQLGLVIALQGIERAYAPGGGSLTLFYWALMGSVPSFARENSLLNILVGLAVHKEAAKRLKGPKAVQRKRTHKPDKQEKKGRPAAGNDSQEDLSVNKVEGKKSRSAAGEDNEEQLMEKGHLSKQEDEVDNRREDAQECLAAGEAAGEKAGGDGSEQPSLLQQQQQQQQRQKEGGLHARGDGAGTSGGRKEVGEVAVQLAMAMAMATDEGLMAHGGEVVAAGGPVKQEQEQAEVVATRDPVTQGQAEVMVTEGLVGQEQAEIQESTGAEGQADGVPGEAG
eukprot:1160332-Pelagomonas_calceolata.AAC.4